MTYQFKLTHDANVLTHNPGTPSLYCIYVSDKRTRTKKLLQQFEGRFPMVTLDTLDLMREKSKRVRFLEKKKSFYFLLIRMPMINRPGVGFGALQFEKNGEFDSVLIKNSEAEMLMFISDYCYSHGKGLNVILDMSNLPNQLVIGHARNFAKRFKEVMAKFGASFDNLNVTVYVPEQE